MSARLITADELTEIFRVSYFRTRQVRTAMLVIESAIEARIRSRARRNMGNAVKRDNQSGAGHPVVAALAKHWDVKPEAVRGIGRVGAVLKARAESAWVFRQLEFSFPVIGALLNRDHSSIISAVRKVDREIAIDKVRGARLSAMVDAQKRAA